MTRAFLSLLLLASAASVIPRFFVLGLTHILPHGLDHIPFLLGLFFLTRSFGVLLFQMTLFTLAHSLTLGLSLYGTVSVPMQIVEIAIASSIAFIAIGIARPSLVRPRRSSPCRFYWADERSW